MEYKFELFVSEMETCKNNFFQAIDSANPSSVDTFAAWTNQNNGAIPDLWAVAYTGNGPLCQFLGVAAGGVDIQMEQSGRMKVGRSYNVTYTVQVNAINPLAAYGFRVTVGGTTNTRNVTDGSPTTYSFAVASASDTIIRFECESRNAVDVYEITVKENTDPLEVDPIGWESAEMQLIEDDDLKGLFFSFTAQLTFITDGFDFLKDLADRVKDNALPLLDISYRCSPSDAWSNPIEGFIDMINSNVDCDRISVNVSGRDLGNALIKYKENPFDLREPYAINGEALLVTPTPYDCDMYFNAGMVTREVFFFYHALEMIISCITNEAIGFDAPVLEHVAFAGATGNAGIYTFTDGWELRKKTPPNFDISLKNTFQSLDFIHNVAGFLFDDAGTYKFKVIEIEDKYSNTKITLSKDLYGIQNLIRNWYQDIRYSGLVIGYNDFDPDQSDDDWGKAEFSFLSFEANGQILDLKNDWIGSRYLTQTQKNVGALPAKSENDFERYLISIDGAITGNIESSGAAWANFNEDIAIDEIDVRQLTLRHDYARFVSGDPAQFFTSKNYARKPFLQYLYEFEVPLTQADFLEIRDNQTDYLEISRSVTPGSGDLINVWPVEVIFRPSTQTAKIKAVSKLS